VEGRKKERKKERSCRFISSAADSIPRRARALDCYCIQLTVSTWSRAFSVVSLFSVIESSAANTRAPHTQMFFYCIPDSFKLRCAASQPKMEVATPFFLKYLWNFKKTNHEIHRTFPYSLLYILR
jgi:hypothetical protein